MNIASPSCTPPRNIRYDFEAYTDTTLPKGAQQQLFLQHLFTYLIYLTRQSYPSSLTINPVLYFPLSVDSAWVKQWIRENFSDWSPGIWPATQYIAISEPLPQPKSSL